MGRGSALGGLSARRPFAGRRRKPPYDGAPATEADPPRRPLLGRRMPPGCGGSCKAVPDMGNFLRRLCLPNAVKHWSLRSVQVKLIKMGGRLVRHSRRLIFQLSEVSVPRRLFDGCSRECWIVSVGYRRRQAEGGYHHDLAKRESAPGSRLVFNALSPHWRGPEDDKDGQEPWFAARIASLIG